MDVGLKDFMGTIDITLIVPVLTLLYLGLWAFTHWRFRRMVSTVFKRHCYADPDLGTINTHLELLNSESPKHVFSVRRFANVQLRSGRVTLIFGPVGFLSVPGTRGNMWNETSCVYSLADLHQVEWMLKNSDVFELAFRGSEAAVFWVKLSILRREVVSDPGADQQSVHRAADRRGGQPL